MKKRRLGACAAALALAALVTACASGSGSTGSTAASGTSTGPINVLDVTATSGATAIYGAQETLGLQAAAAYYNANGGILGR